MFRHSLQLIWNRRRAEMLVVIEIALAFVAAFAVLSVFVTYWTNYRQPLGYQYDRIWNVGLRTGNNTGPNSGWDLEQAQLLRSALQVIRNLPRVEAAHVIRVTPFTDSRSNAPYLWDGERLIPTAANAVTSGALPALGAKLIEGRWFDETNEGQSYRAAIVNRAYVAKAFGPGVNPLNKNINQLLDHPPPGASLDQLPPFFRREVRIVGVVDKLRASDLAEEIPLVVIQYELEHAVENAIEHPRALFVKVAPGTTADFEQQISATLKSVAPYWGVEIVPWSTLREQMHSRVLTPFIIGAVLVSFVLLMVALGLLGVVWQGVIRRTQEIGLRRAVGATARNVRLQVVVELIVTALFGIGIGAVIAVQLPLMKLIKPINWSSAPPGLVLAAALILVLVMLSAAYPGWIASRREPADALRYE